jgi:hypothetical protein
VAQKDESAYEPGQGIEDHDGYNNIHDQPQLKSLSYKIFEQDCPDYARQDQNSQQQADNPALLGELVR